MVNWVDKIPNEVDGTPVNRGRLMAMQGMEASTTEFLTDGSIKETYGDGVKVTAFLSDGSIRETFTANDGKTIAKVTSFLADGSVQEVIV